MGDDFIPGVCAGFVISIILLMIFALGYSTNGDRTCESYADSTMQNIPGRCLNEFTK